jgi:uncharacterized protein YjbJ (UPF0337 family)
MSQMGNTSDRFSGLAKLAAGKVKAGVGKATGDELETERAAQNLKGKGPERIGDTKSTGNDVVNKNLHAHSTARSDVRLPLAGTDG